MGSGNALSGRVGLVGFRKLPDFPKLLAFKEFCRFQQVRGGFFGLREPSTLMRGPSTQVRGPSTQMREAPMQVREAPTRVRRLSTRVRETFTQLRGSSTLLRKREERRGAGSKLVGLIRPGRP